MCLFSFYPRASDAGEAHSSVPTTLSTSLHGVAAQMNNIVKYVIVQWFQGIGSAKLQRPLF
jgi:hypothetical protein